MMLVALTLQTCFTDRLTRQSPVGSFDDLFVVLARPVQHADRHPLTPRPRSAGTSCSALRRAQCRARNLCGRGP